jgi:uncharacterized membrane protein
MKEWLTAVTDVVVLLIDTMALVIIVAGTIQAFLSGIRMVSSSPDTRHPRDIWLRYSRWLVAGLTFQLAADIVETSIAPSDQGIGHGGGGILLALELEELVDREAEGDERGCRPHPGHHGALVRESRALDRQARPAIEGGRAVRCRRGRHCSLLSWTLIHSWTWIQCKQYRVPTASIGP